MAKMNEISSKYSWKEIKVILEKSEEKELLSLIKDLYSLNKDNKHFVHARLFHDESSLEPYKKIIEDAVYPDIYKKNSRIRLSDGKKAIREYKAASKDPNNILELMVFFIECGNNLTINVGDIDEQFYDSLCNMFDDVLKLLKDSEQEVVDRFRPRLQNVVNDAQGIGWGYFDYINDVFHRAFPDEEV